jgi:hypothetical protein
MAVELFYGTIVAVVLAGLIAGTVLALWGATRADEVSPPREAAANREASPDT